ncbi:2-keto-3-deoxygluconate permease [Peribacillus simplex]|uniref:2-keto-3-deoxygluconate permease n=1 Tax=Peribacillus simplex TaxID=1478 RepID=A0A9W4PJE2_9BACI|nr:2-keto-3-deoxygluconate permease [Peribacillus simplex]
MDRYVTGSDGVAGVAASSTAIIATSVLVTAILTPMLTMWVAKKQEERGIPQRRGMKPTILKDPPVTSIQKAK